MAIQEAFASSPRLPGENGGGANNGHASLIAGEPPECSGGGGGHPPQPHQQPAVCSSCSASCSTASSPPSVPHHPAVLCPAKEFRRSIIYCGEFGKSLIDIGQLSAKTVGALPGPTTVAKPVSALPGVTVAKTVSALSGATVACAAVATITEPGAPCCPNRVDNGNNPPGSGEEVVRLSAINPLPTAASPPALLDSSLLQSTPEQPQPPEATAGIQLMPALSNGSVAGPLPQTAVVRQGAAAEREGHTPKRDGGGQARSRQGPRHRFIINLDDKNKFTEEVTV